jgi:branched-chain amino acid transport system substrate-binding protein
MPRNWAIAFGALCLTVLIAGQGCDRDGLPKTDSKQKVKIGAVLPLTGEVANYGQDTKAGVDLAVDIANHESKKYEFEIIYEDSKGLAKEGVLATQKLVNTNKVSAIIGDNVSAPTMAIVPVTDKSRVVLLSPSASSPKLSGISKYFFRVYPSDTAEGSLMAETAYNKLHLRSVGVLYVNNDFGVGLRDVFSKEFAALGGNIAVAEGYSQEQTDFRTILTTAKDMNPDGLYLAGYYKDGGLILKQARELGFTTSMLGATTHEDPQLIAIAGNAAEGLVYPYSTGYDAQSQRDVVKGFIGQFQNRYKRDPGLIAALGYDCTNLLVRAVEDRGASAEAIRAYLADVNDFPGAAGNISFDRNGDVHKPILLKVVRNGAFASYSGF